MEHPIIDVALGLIFFYVVLSLVASAVQEWIASVCGLRSKNLKQGIDRLVGDVYAQKVYNHPLIQNLAKKNQIPSYISSETLTTVLLDVVATDTMDAGTEDKSFTAQKVSDVRKLVKTIDANNPVRAILIAFLDDREDDITHLKKRVASWFDEGMVRVSGWYKRKVKLFLFGIAVAVTVSLNASTIHIARELWENDALRAQVAAAAQAAATTEELNTDQKDNLANLEIFPIGWENPPTDACEWLTTFFGWLITIAAVSLGAPFWFDLLGKVANLKGAGGAVKTPKEGDPKKDSG